MTRILAILALCCTLFSCGKDGSDGRDGETPKPIPGQPGSDSIVDKRVCKMEWQLGGEPAGRKHVIEYNVLFYKEGLKLASLKVTYKTANDSMLDEAKSALSADSDQPLAPLETALWIVSLTGDFKSFDVYRKPTKEMRSAVCL